MEHNVAIIGGGASGLMAAYALLERGAKVTIFERGEKLAKKLYMTGNGRCNFTNKRMDTQCFFSSTTKDISIFLEEFGLPETLEIFHDLGLYYKEKQGYYYPYSEQATSLIQVLCHGIERYSHHLNIYLEHKVSEVFSLKEDKVAVVSKKKEYHFDQVILACGGQAVKSTGSDGTGYYLLQRLGYEMEQVVPALVQLKVKENYFSKLAGVRTEGCAKVFVEGICRASSEGELQLTDYGISGIPVFQVSRFASIALAKKEKVVVSLDLFPQMEETDFITYMMARRARYINQTLHDFYRGLLHEKLIDLCIVLKGFSGEECISKLSDESFLDMVKWLKEWEVEIIDTMGFERAQVCAGGLSMEAINHKFELKNYKNIYVIGELLDVDALCGGYNLQWAWTSAYLCGKYIMEEKGGIQ